MRKICVFLGNRANYSSLKPIIREIKEDPQLELILFAGASALLDKYGAVTKFVEKDGFKINEHVYMLIEGALPITMARSVGLGLLDIPTLLEKHKPDFTLIIGDRFEMLAPAVSSALMNIPIVHTMGGEVSGTIDESIRHAITKLAHVHFVANEAARERVIKMGEDPKMVFNFGCPRIDTVKETLDKNYDQEIDEYLKKAGVGNVLSISNKKFILVAQYPVTTEFGKGEEQINETLSALSEIEKERDIPVIMLWPNPDAGSEDVAQGIRRFREKYGFRFKNFRFVKNFPPHLFNWAMKKTSCMVGNSSSGIREGAFIGTPVVNIGTREKGRDKGKNVLDVGYNKSEIKTAVLRQIKHGHYPSDPLYGDGNTAKRIVDVLRTIKVNPQKKIHY